MRLVYFSPVPWKSFSQRSHKFVEWFHLRHAGEVLWVEPHPTRFPIWRDLRRLHPGWNRTIDDTPKRSPGWLRVLRPFAVSMEPLSTQVGMNTALWRRTYAAISDFLAGGGRCVIGVGKPSSLALEVLQRHPDVTSLLDAMDDFPAFYKGPAKRMMEVRVNRIASHVSRILISSEALKRRFRDQQEKLLLVRNACDIGALPPAASVRRDAGSPVLGYVGTIGDWFDWPLLIALAEAVPSTRVRLIGPVYVPGPRSLPNNVEVWPALNHGAAIEAMRNFSSGLIPFRYTELTYAVDPIKYYEYRALGLPVISSRFGRMAFRESKPGVFLVDDHSDLADQIRLALDYRHEEDEISTFREKNSWTARFDASRILDDPAIPG